MPRLPGAGRRRARRLAPPAGSTAHARAGAGRAVDTGSARPARRRIARSRRRRCPCRAGLVVSNGLNRRSRMNSGVMPTPVSVTSITAKCCPAGRARTATRAAAGRRIERVLHQVADHVLEPVLVPERRQCRRRVRGSIGIARRRCARTRAAPPLRGRSTAAFPPGSRPVRNCSMSWFIRPTTCSTVASMSRWNSGLSRWRSAFLQHQR